MKRLLLVAAVLAGLAVACSSAPDESQNQDPAQEPTEQGSDDLTKAKRCGPIANGTCPSGYHCDMSGVPAGSMGGTGVCKKDHACVLNGLFVCPKGQSFDPKVCHCH